MKTVTSSAKMIMFFVLLIGFGCSTNEDPGNLEEEFLVASIDGQEFKVNKLTGSVTCQKQLSDFGTINLSVKVVSAEGRSIEFLIPNYLGKQLYNIGDRTQSIEGNFTNGSWLNYSQIRPQELWSSLYDNYSDGNIQNFIEITEDNGKFVSGRFSSESYLSTGPLPKMITDGTFELRISR